MINISENQDSNYQIAKYLLHIAGAKYLENHNDIQISQIIRSANTIKYYPVPIVNLKIEDLHKIPSINNILEYILPIIENRELTEYKNIINKFPDGFFALSEIPGIGFKNAYYLSNILGITRYHSAITKLRKSVTQNELKSSNDFPTSTILHIKKSLYRYLYYSQNPRITLFEADYEVNILKQKLNIEIYPIGSYRQQIPLLKYIKILITNLTIKDLIQKFKSINQVQITKIQDNSIILFLHSVPLQIYTTNKNRLGTDLFYLTGPQSHIKFVESRNSKITISTDFSNEHDIYNFANLPYLNPEIRYLCPNSDYDYDINTQLIRLEDIKGDLHTHSNFETNNDHDNGVSSMTEFIQTSIANKYKYIGFSEHNPSFDKNNFSQRVKLMKNKYHNTNILQKIFLNNENTSMKIFCSLELDMPESGECLLSDEELKYLDFYITSIHDHFNLNQDQNTSRIIRSMSYPKAKILGHPTTRTFKWRPSIKADWDRIFEFASSNKKFLEINSWPDRLDLPTNLILKAKQKQCKFIIGSDAHQHNHLDMIKYGVSQARRAGLSKSDVINTYDLNLITKLLLTN